MKKGGYQIIDLKNFNIDNGNSVTIKGIYNILKEVKKPLLLSGIIIKGKEQQDRFILPEGGTPNYVIKITSNSKPDISATVKPDDTVTFAAI